MPAAPATAGKQGGGMSLTTIYVLCLFGFAILLSIITYK
jgi:hypothetical protein